MAEILSPKQLSVVLILAILALSSRVETVEAFIEPILMGTDPQDAYLPASVDILKAYLSNDGTCFRFIVECRATPNPSAYIYRVYLNTKGDGAIGGTYAGADFYIQGGGTPGLYKWVSGGWTYKSSTDVEVISNSIYLTALLSDIGYPGNIQETISIVVATFQYGNLKDGAPDTGNFSIVHKVIPDLPWPTPIVTIPAVLMAVYMIHKQRFKRNG